MLNHSYIHIGYSKCASSALQKHFFAQHPQLYHLGMSEPGIVPGYIDDDMRLLMECDIRMKRDFLYDADKAKAIIHKHYERFEASGKTAFGLSAEWLTSDIANGADTTQKAQRLAAIFGDDVKILLVTRNPRDLLQSMYRERVRAGISFTFNEFLHVICENQCRSIWSDLNVDNITNLYGGLFGAGKLLEVDYETLKESPADTLGQICDWLGVEKTITELPASNESFSSEMFERMRQLNAEQPPRNLARTSLEALYTNRYAEFYTDELGIEAPESAEKDFQAQLSIVRQAKQDVASGLATQPMDYTIDKAMEAQLRQLFGERWA